VATGDTKVAAWQLGSRADAASQFSIPFQLETDASGTGLGAVLMQQGQPVAYFSKSLGPKAAALSVYEKEALAILEAL
jgi:hypothetical protein